MEPTETVVATEIAEPNTTAEASNSLVVEELLLEEISIDGMCGVY